MLGVAHDRRGGTVRREHDRVSCRYVCNVIDKDHTALFEAIDDHLVVHDLVVAVHRAVERADHPRESFDRHFHPGAKAARRGEQDFFDGHA